MSQGELRVQTGATASVFHLRDCKTKWFILLINNFKFQNCFNKQDANYTWNNNYLRMGTKEIQRSAANKDLECRTALQCFATNKRDPEIQNKVIYIDSATELLGILGRAAEPQGCVRDNAMWKLILVYLLVFR